MSVVAVMTVATSAFLFAGQDPTSGRRAQVEREALAALENWDVGHLPDFFDKLKSLGGPTPFEHAWVLAWVAMTQRFYNPCNGAAEVTEVIDRALRRFPGDSRLLLARLLATPGAFAVSNRPGVAADRLATGFWCHGWLRRPGGPRPQERAKTIPLTREGFRALASDPIVGDEARARLALLEYILGDLDASLADVAGATGSADPFVRNLAGVVAGLTWDAKGQPDSALAAYRTAVEALPRSTAAVAFATHAFLAGQRAAANTALAEALPPRPYIFEPWDGPLAGDRFLSRYLADLRTMLGLPPREFLAPPNTGGFGPESMGLIAPVVGRAAPMPDLPTNFQAVVPATATSSVPPNPRTFRATATTVLVDASVRLNRRPVTGLTVADFELLDNGVPQSVEAVSIEPIPLDVTFVVDTRDSLHSDVPPDVRANNPLAAALSRVEDVTRALRPDDRVRVIEANVHAVELRPWTSVRDISGRPIKPTYDYGIGWGTSAICDATVAALIHPVPTNRRSLVIVLTIGLDGVSLTTPAQLSRVAQQSDGTIILVRHETKNEADARRIAELRRARGLSVSVPPDRDNERLLWPKDIEGLSRMVRDSGGYVFEVRDGTTSADRIREVLADFAQRYLLRYSVQGVSPDGWHAITVKVKRPGNHTVVARRGYFGG